MEPDPGNGTRPSGCQVIDVEFRSPTLNTIGCISFRNYYTHSLTLKYQRRISKSKSDQQWKTCIRTLQLMPNCHCERGSENLIVLNKAHFGGIQLENVTRLRLILRQPSPDWSQFGIRDLKCYSVSSPFHQDVTRGNGTGTTALSSQSMERSLQYGLWTGLSDVESQTDTATKPLTYSVTILSHT